MNYHGDNFNHVKSTGKNCEITFTGTGLPLVEFMASSEDSTRGLFCPLLPGLPDVLRSFL